MSVVAIKILRWSALVAWLGGTVAVTASQAAPSIAAPAVHVQHLQLGAAPIVLITSSARNEPANEPIFRPPAWSPDSRRLAFDTCATNLIPGVGRDCRSNGYGTHGSNVFVKDVRSGAITLISSTVRGTPANGYSQGAEWSPDGSSIAFDSCATNLVPSLGKRSRCSTAAYRSNVFVKHLGSGKVTLVTAGSRGVPANDSSKDPRWGYKWSPDGLHILFTSCASNLVPNFGDPGHCADTQVIFMKNLRSGKVVALSANANGAAANGSASAASWSPDGRRIAFESCASNLVPGMSHSTTNCSSPAIFVKDVRSGSVTLISSNAGAEPADGASRLGSWSPNGRSIAFFSCASNLVPRVGNPQTCRSTHRANENIFVKHILSGLVTLVNRTTSGEPADGAAGVGPLTWSPDGRWVTFVSCAPALVGSSSPYCVGQPFAKNLRSGKLVLLNSTSRGTPGKNDSGWNRLSWSPGSLRVAFESCDENLVPRAGSPGGRCHVFIKDLSSGAVALVSSNAQGIPGNSVSGGPSWSPDGKWILFGSIATNLVRGTAGRDEWFAKRLGR